MEELLSNWNIVAIVMLIIAVLTAVKKFLKRIEKGGKVTGVLKVVVVVLERILELVTANDGQTD